MSYCREEGKDKVIFVTEEDHKKPMTVPIDFDEDDESAQGLIRPDGSINWNCPCLGGMATGPCGTEFRDSFSCFHYSKEEMKGSDCMEAFQKMQECMSKYPDLYGQYDKDDEEGEDDIEPPEDEDEDEGKKGVDRPTDSSPTDGETSGELEEDKNSS